MSSRGRKRIPNRLSNYVGPYSYQMLNDARYTLIKAVDTRETVIWSRIRSKTGIYDNGERDAQWEGFGETSTYYSHADLVEENPLEGEYLPRVTPSSSTSSVTSATITSDMRPESPAQQESSSKIHAQFEENPDNFKFNFSEGKKGNEIEAKSDVGLTSNPQVKTGRITDSAEMNNTRLQNKETQPEKYQFDAELKHVVKKHENQTVVQVSTSVEDCLEEGEIIEIDETDGDVVNISDDPENNDLGDFKRHLDPVIVISDDNLTRTDGLKYQRKSGKGVVKDHLQPIIVIGEDSDKCDDSVIIIDTPEKTNAHKKQSMGSSDHKIDRVLQRVPAFKCDFCDQICETASGMTEHLNKFSHFSASKINLDKDKGVYDIQEKLAVMVKKNLYKAVVAVCPNPVCNEMFKTTYACALHHRIQHDRSGNLSYGLADVLRTQEFPNPFFSCKCPVCGDTSKKPEKSNKKKSKRSLRKRDDWNLWLILHYRQTNHYPFNFKVGDCRFLCTDCDKGFDDNLFKAQCHEVEHQKYPYTHDMKLIVIQTGDVKVHELPETDQEGNISLKEIRLNETKDIRAKQAADGNSKESMQASSYESPAIESDDNVEMNDPDEESSIIDRKPTPVSQSNGMIGGDDVTSIQLPDSDTERNSITRIDTNDAHGETSQSDTILVENSPDLTGQYRFLCDYCDTLDMNRNVIYQHLIKDCHSSASIVQVDSKGKPVTLFRQKSVSNYRAAYKKMAAACPIEGCHMLFPDIYQCNMHCKVFHDCYENIYGVTEICKSSELKVSGIQTCNTCKTTFTSGHMFKTHLDETGHLSQGLDILVPSESKNIHFVCSYCEMIIDTYFMIVNHLRKTHKFRSIQDYFKIRVVHTDKIVSKLNMLPFSSHLTTETGNIHANLKVVTELKRHGGKQHRRKLHKEKKKLKDIQKKLNKKHK